MDSKRMKGAIALIVSQTNYTEDEAKEKLIKWNYDYMSAIKEYLNPNFNKKEKKEPVKSLNQRTMNEIRHFMDDVNRGYEKRKKREEYIKIKEQEYKHKIYLQFLNEKKKHPHCQFDPPKINTCSKECKNPLCPGELSADNKIYSKSNIIPEQPESNVDVNELNEDTGEL